MSGGRPRTSIGTYGEIRTWARGGRYVAETRYRDLDGRLRKVNATAATRGAARALLKERLLVRPGYGSGGRLTLASPFLDLVELWLADLELRDLTEGTRENYRDDLRVHITPVFEHYTLGEITTGRVEWFLKREAGVSYSRAKHSRTMLKQLFGFALRHDAIPRNPVEGTSPLKKPTPQPQALTLEQITAIRNAAAIWRTGPDVKGPKPDPQVKQIIEVLLGTALRIGEALALRVKDIEETPDGLVLHVRGTVVLRTGRGAVRQDHPKTEASIRSIAVPEFAAKVLRARIRGLGDGAADRTLFSNRTGGPLSPFNVRRTFREFLQIAGLGESGISLRWYRRTGATVIARAADIDTAATFLGHASTAITEGHYIEPDKRIDRSPAALLERALRPDSPDQLLADARRHPVDPAALEAIVADGSD